MIVLCCISWPCSYCVMPSMVWSSAPCRRPPLQCLPQEQDMISPALHLVGVLKAFVVNLFCISVGYLIARLLLKFIFDKLRSIQLSPVDSCCRPIDSPMLYAMFAWISSWFIVGPLPALVLNAADLGSTIAGLVALTRVDR
jgi:hypothetical protein